MRPEDCPKFARCNAPICPLDPDWEQRSHLQGDSSCLYMRESMKPGAILGGVDAELVCLATYVARKVVDRAGHGRFGALRRQLLAAATTGSVRNRVVPA